MNTKDRSYESKHAAPNRAEIKTMHLQVAVTEPNLKTAVMTAFDLAKSGGRELNLDFNLQSFAQPFPKHSSPGAAHLVSSRAGC